MTAPEDRVAPEGAAPSRRRRWRLAIILLVVLAALAGGAVLLTRFGVVTPQGRMLIEARTEGLKLGRFGRLKVEGLHGDVWRDFRVERLTIRDEEGVWLEGRDLHVVWDYGALFRRRFEAESITAQQVRLLRRPTLAPKTESRGLPISFEVNSFRTQVEMLPAFSQRRGVYDLSGALRVGRRNGGQSGRITALSVLHPGDRLDARFSFGGKLPLLLEARGVEAQGGALAGALGLPADKPFRLIIDARGQKGSGRFSAQALTNGAQVLSAQGGWSAQAMQASGVFALDASTLTAPVAVRLGPQLRFEASGSAVRDGLRNVSATLVSDKAQLRIAGPIDAKRRQIGRQGVQIAALVDPAADLLANPKIGRVALDASVTGGLSDWRLQGRLAAQRLQTADFALAQVSGPLTLFGRKGEITVQAQLTGAGGAGDGLIAALLGRAPTAQVQARRLKDGRLLVEDFRAQGAGLRVTARGDRTLLGALDFRGEAQLTNLAAVRPGARGAVAASWRARQRNVEAPWDLQLDARGRQLATGFDELNRLLGPRPRLTAEAEVGRGGANVRRARLDGAQLDATAVGAITPALRLDIDWRGRGPFGVGPIEVAGDIRGTGALTGSLGSPAVQLVASAGRVDIPRLPLTNARLELRLQPGARGANGRFALTAKSPYGPARAAADLAFPPGALRLTNLSLDAGGVRALGTMALARGAPSQADLRLEVGPGALLASGELSGAVRLEGNGRSGRAIVDLIAAQARPVGSDLTIGAARLQASGPLERLPYTLTASGAAPQGRWNLQGSGQLAGLKAPRTLTFQGGGAFAGETLRTSEPAILRFGGGANSARVRLVTGRGGQLSADGSLTKAGVDLRAQATGIQLGLVNRDLEGRLDATAILQGQGRNLTGALQARLSGARAIGSDPDFGIAADVEARLSGDTVSVRAQARNAQGLRADADLLLPARSSASPLRLAINRQRPIRGDFSASGEIRPLWDLLIGGDRSLAGQAQIAGRLGGTLADPRITGRASVQNGRFEDGATGLVLQQARLNATFSGERVEIAEFRGQGPNGGQVGGSGRIDLRRGGAGDFQLRLQNFQVIDTELARATASGTATLVRAPDGKISVRGRLTVDEAEISAAEFRPAGVVTMDVIEINKPPEVGRATPTARPASPLSVAMDVQIRAPRRVHVRGRGLDLELGVNAHVGGTTAAPSLTGTARVIRGDYTFAGKRFVFDDDGVVYLSTDPDEIRLNLTATREDPSLTAVIHIGGVASRPEITLSSTPALPQDEVLAQVLFGRSASQLSTLEAARLAAALSSLSGGGGFDILGNLRSLTGLDRLALVGGESGLAVQGGKYISDDVYLEIIGGGREGPAVQVEWQVSRRLSIFSRLAGQGGADLAVRWRRDY